MLLRKKQQSIYQVKNFSWLKPKTKERMCLCIQMSVDHPSEQVDGSHAVFKGYATP